jgi:thioredoxin-dependent peroxiredoxin
MASGQTRVLKNRKPASIKHVTPTPAQRVDVGAMAPSFTLNDQHGQAHHLADYRGRWVILYFYPKDDTPGCTKEACQFRNRTEEFHRRNAVVLGISPDTEASHHKFAQKFTLPFTLLADPGAAVCGRYGVWREKSMYGRKYLGVVRTTYLIRPDGRIAHRWDGVSVAGHDADVLTRLEQYAAACG